MADTVNATQADREAMEHWVSMCCDLSFDVSDAESLVHAFARHRLASTQPAPAREHRFGSPPEPVVNPSADWCDAYADWYYQENHRG